MKLKFFLSFLILLSKINFTYATQNYNLNDYFEQIELKSIWPIPTSIKNKIIKYYNKNNLGPNNVLNSNQIRDQRDLFNSQRITLIEAWHNNLDVEWPTYKNNTLCKQNGECYWKKIGYRYDAHHIIPISHKGPNIWWNIWPLSTTAHTSIHTDNHSPCCHIFPHSCGSRGEIIDVSDYFTGWEKNNKSITRVINGKNVVITKMTYDQRSKDHYRIKINNEASGKSFEKLYEAKEAAIELAFQ